MIEFVAGLGPIPAHLVSICERHHLGGWATSHRPDLRAYLRAVAS